MKPTLRQLPNFSAPPTRSVRRASGLVLVGKPEVTILLVLTSG